MEVIRKNNCDVVLIVQVKLMSVEIMLTNRAS